MKKSRHGLGRIKSAKAQPPLSLKKHRLRRKYSKSWLDEVELIGMGVSLKPSGSVTVSTGGTCWCGTWGAGAGAKVGMDDSGNAYELLADGTPLGGDYYYFDDSDVVDLGDPDNYNWDYASIASKHYTDHVKSILPNLNLPQIRPLTNAAGVWVPESVESLIATEQGAAFKTVSLATLGCFRATVGVGRDQAGNIFAFGSHASLQPRQTSVTDVVPLPKADSYAMEVDIDAKTGHTRFWVNDVGIDVGVLAGFKGGAHFAGFGGGTLVLGDHMLSGRFTNCAVATAKGWQPASLANNQLMGCIPPHIQVKANSDGLTCRDLRSRVA
ncbi:MAG TPA: hypothetical protein VHC95_03210 [Opitutales bacterium]|nr:hypothetical protein [Opitutales bacterium]